MPAKFTTEPLTHITYGLWLVLIFFTACTTTPAPPATKQVKALPSDPLLKLGAPVNIRNDGSILLYPTEFAYLAGWDKDDHASAFNSFQHSCQSWRNQPNDRILGGAFELGKIGDWKQLCNISVATGKEKQFFEQWFKPYAVADTNGFDGLFTGYYLPELHGSFKKTERYQVPVYGMPKDLVKRDQSIGRYDQNQFQPYFNRAEIKAGALNGKHAEILWVDDEVDAFFMEIQGSGKVIMEDGHVQSLSFAGKNGREYYAIGKTLVDNGSIPREQISMQTIRAWIKAHPEEGRQLMLQNQSVIFFRPTDSKATEGPTGTMNIPLTAGYSMAVDKTIMPLGVPLWLDADHPLGQQRIRRLLMAQDTGGAIKGLIRGDVYWGQGQQAGELAGLMKSKGRFFLLIPRHIAVG
jgi:membrane-bound lytic murein transglycosylase A